MGGLHGAGRDALLLELELSESVQQARLPDGSRRIISVTEVTGMEGSIITTQDIFVFEQTGVDPNGRVRGRFRATGVRPKFTDRLASNGIRLSHELFRFVQEV